MISDTLFDAAVAIERYLADDGSYADWYCEIDQQIRQLLAHMDAVRQWLDTPHPETDLGSPNLASHVAQLRIWRQQIEVNDQTLRAIAELVLYLHHDERKHHEEMLNNDEDVSTHIFNAVQAVADWLNEQPGNPLARMDAERLAEMKARWEAVA